MNTPRLDIAIKGLELDLQPLSELRKEVITEYKAIKSIIENSPIVSTPEKPVWVVDEDGRKRILLADLGEKVINSRFLLVCPNYNEEYKNGDEFDFTLDDIIYPYTPKVNIEVTEEEAIKVEEFLKTLRNGN
jgi:hypothetical protein